MISWTIVCIMQAPHHLQSDKVDDIRPSKYICIFAADWICMFCYSLPEEKHSIPAIGRWNPVICHTSYNIEHEHPAGFEVSLCRSLSVTSIPEFRGVRMDG